MTPGMTPRGAAGGVPGQTPLRTPIRDKMGINPEDDMEDAAYSQYVQVSEGEREEIVVPRYSTLLTGPNGTMCPHINWSTLVQVMAWHLQGARPLPFQCST